MRFEHKSTYLPVAYTERTSGVLIFKSKELPLEPDIEMFFAEKGAKNHMREIEAEGYELVTVQPLLKAVVQQNKDHGPQAYGFAFPLTAGFVLFWRRPAMQGVA